MNTDYTVRYGQVKYFKLKQNEQKNRTNPESVKSVRVHGGNDFAFKSTVKTRRGWWVTDGESDD